MHGGDSQRRRAGRSRNLSGCQRCPHAVIAVRTTRLEDLHTRRSRRRRQGSHYPRGVQSDDPRPEQLPLWADEPPPNEATPFLDLIEHLRAQGWAQVDATLRDMADTNSVRSILQRQASAMEVMRASFEQSEPMDLLPDFTGDDYEALEDAVLALISQRNALAHLEQAVKAATVDPESRKLVVRITERLPGRAQVVKLTPWAVFVMVSLDLLKVAPELNPNDIGVLTMILMVVLYLLPPRPGS